jgi:hypothetical protein
MISLLGNMLGLMEQTPRLFIVGHDLYSEFNMDYVQLLNNPKTLL